MFANLIIGTSECFKNLYKFIGESSLLDRDIKNKLVLSSILSPTREILNFSTHYSPHPQHAVSKVSQRDGCY